VTHTRAQVRTDVRRNHGSRRSRQATKPDRHSAEEKSRRAGGETWPQIREEWRWPGGGTSETRRDEIQWAEDERNAKSGPQEDAGPNDDEISRQVSRRSYQLTPGSDRGGRCGLRYFGESSLRSDAGPTSSAHSQCGGNSSSCEGPARCCWPRGFMSSNTVRPPSDRDKALFRARSRTWRSASDDSRFSTTLANVSSRANPCSFSVWPSCAESSARLRHASDSS
jgi:hypothetical protein